MRYTTQRAVPTIQRMAQGRNERGALIRSAKPSRTTQPGNKLVKQVRIGPNAE